MNFQKIAKFTLLSLLLAGGATAYAQSTEPTEVMLKDNKTKVSWSTFVNAINNPSSVQADRTALDKAKKDYTADSLAYVSADALETETRTVYETASKNLTQWQSRLQTLNSSTDKTPEDWLKESQENALAFQKAFDLLEDEDYTGNTVMVYYKITGTRQKSLYLSFITPPTEEGYNPSVGETAFYEALSGTSFKNLYVYLGVNYTSTSNDHNLRVNSFSGNFDSSINNAVDAIETLVNSGRYDKNAAEIADLSAKIAEYTTTDDKGETKLDQLLADYQAAQAAKTAADKKRSDSEKAVTAAQTAYEAASATALENYKTVTLNAYVTATETLDTFDGTIYGEGHVITLGDGVTALIGTFSGGVANAAVNGPLCKLNSNASFNNVAIWANGTGTFYDGHNNVTERIGTLGQLGFTARETFGVNFADNTLVALNKNEASKVYSITEYQPNSTKHYYVQTLADSKFYTENNTEYSIPVNTFVKSDSYDLKGDNIFYEDNSCPNVVIEDNAASFYCPVDLQAGKVTYPREFHAGMNSVCLPFEITYDSNENIEALCTFDKETDVKFWFKKDGQKADANTPILISAKADFTLDNLNDIVIKQTPTTQMIIDEGDADDPSKAYGIFKKATRDEFQGGASEAHKVFGLTKSGTFQAAGDGVNFPAFRLVLYSATAQQSGPMAAPRRIGILDEKGIEITDGLTTGIDSVTTGEEASDLEITTGAGEITFTAAADYGRVEVYTLDGKVAAIAKVAAGTTTVNVQNGVYIVMGKKVMVK